MNEPLAFRVRVPWLGPDTSTALNALPSGSLSLPNTPGAGTVSAVSSAVVYGPPPPGRRMVAGPQGERPRGRPRLEGAAAARVAERVAPGKVAGGGVGERAV